MAWEDPIVEEVRGIRDAYARQFNYDLDAIYRILKTKERKSDRTIVSCPLEEPASTDPLEKPAGELT